MGCPLWGYWRKTYRVITAPHCNTELLLSPETITDTVKEPRGQVIRCWHRAHIQYFWHHGATTAILLASWQPRWQTLCLPDSLSRRRWGGEKFQWGWFISGMAATTTGLSFNFNTPGAAKYHEISSAILDFGVWSANTSFKSSMVDDCRTCW